MMVVFAFLSCHYDISSVKWRNRNEMKHTTDFAENQRNSLVRCLFGDSCPAGRRIAGAAIGLLLLASAAMALTFLNFGDELVAVRADSDGQNISCSDALTETPDCPEAQDDSILFVLQ